MAQDLVTLYNQALSAVGTRAKVAHQNENSRESEVCNTWFDSVRDQALSAAHWASCRTVAQLTKFAERDWDEEWAEGDPEPPWTYLYNLPSDYLYPRHLDTYENFEVTQVAGARMILSDSEVPVLTYTKRQTNLAAWEPELFLAVSFALAAYIGMPLHGKPQRAALAQQQANQLIMDARLKQANRDSVHKETIPDWLLARGVSSSTLVSQYIYNYGPMFSNGSLV